MPLLTFDLIEGRTEQEVKTLLDAAHRAVLRAFEVPERDRYQIVHENKAHHMVIEDTGLGRPARGIWWWCGSIPARAAGAEAALLRHFAGGAGGTLRPERR